MGWDSISVKLIKKFNFKITPILCTGINETILTNKLPKELKTARITPIFKSGSKQDINNYRPISVLPTFSKIFEKIIHERLQLYLDNNQLISSNQFGFQRNSSTLSAILNLLENIYNNLEARKFTSCIFIDLAKAFDCIDHNILLKKLSSLGVIDSALSLLEDYLLNRKHYVQMGKYKSEELFIKCGVPQGSILGPLLFNIYINDVFLLNLSGKLQLFADDAVITYDALSREDLQLQMETDLKILNSFFLANKLRLNKSKTKFIIFSVKNKLFDDFREISLDLEKISRVDNICYLGLNLCYNLNWTTHINSIKQKLAPYVAVFRRIGKYITNQQVALNCYYSFVHSRLLYLIQIWGSAGSTKVKELQIYQNQALKAIKNIDMRTPTIFLYSNRLLPISQMVEYEFILLVYKLKYNMIKSNNVLITNYEITERANRSAAHFRLPQYFYKISQSSFFYRGLKLFNDLEDNWKSMPLGIFKTNVKNLLLSEFVQHYRMNHIVL